MLRIGMLTSGGDCQALNAAMRGVVKALVHSSDEPVEFYGFENGYQGMIYGNYRQLTEKDFQGILTRGGTMLGTSRTPFKLLDEPTPEGINKVEAMKENYRKLKLDCLVMGGGNGSTKTANRLHEEGLNVIALPKTIDNDTWGTDMTFGFHSAIEIATKCIDDIHTTASSHGRVFVIEIMGHKVGWIPLYAGVAGGADVILLPEIPYDINNVIKVIDERNRPAAASPSSPSPRAPSPSRRPASSASTTSSASPSAPPPPSPTTSQPRSSTAPTARSAWPCPVTPSAVALPAPTTASSPLRWASRPHAASWPASTASWSPTRTARSCACRSTSSPAA